MNVRKTAGTLLSALVLAGCGSAAVAPVLTGSAVPVYALESGGSGAGMRLEKTMALGAGRWSIAVADFVAGDQNELALIGDGEIRLFEIDGTPLGTFTVPPPAVKYGFVEDIDGDGKADFVLGSRDDSTSRVRVLDNRGEVIAEASYGSLVNGATTPHFFHGGIVYFTAGPQIGATPRVTGTFAPATGAIEWLREDGVQPTGLAYSPGLATIGIHNRGTTRDLRDADPETVTPGGRSALLTVDPSGSTVAFRPMGSPVIEGAGGSAQVSLVESYPVRVDGTDAGYAVVTVNRESSVYVGPSEILLVNQAGETLHTRTGPPASRASVAIDDGLTSGSGRFSVAVLWSSTGVIELLDDSLAVRRTIALPGEWHNARIGAAVDLDTDGELDFLVADLDTLSVVTHSAGLASQQRFGGEIRDLAVDETQDGPLLFVLANDLHFVRITDANDDGNAYAATPRDTLTTRPSESSTLIVSRLGSDQGLTALETSVIAETALPGEYQFAGTHDVIGDEEIELAFVHPSRSHWVFLRPSLEVAAQFVAPERFTTFSIEGDLDDDGKDDIVLAAGSPEHTILALDSSGNIVFRTPLSPSSNTTMRPLELGSDALWIGAVSGHMLRPRGVYALDIPGGAIRYFYPTAGFPNDVVSLPGVAVVSNYTPDNAAAVARSDGLVDTDDTMFVHAVNPDGSPHEWASPVEFEQKRGNLRFFAMDADGDGADEAYFTVFRDETYNPGPTGIFRIDADGTPILMVPGPEDSVIAPYVARVSGRDRLLTQVRPGGLLSLHAADLSRIASWNLDGARFVGAWDASSDGGLEILILKDGGVEYSQVGTPGIIRLEWPDETIRGAWISSGERSGAHYLVLKSDTRIASVAFAPVSVIE